MVYIHPSLKRLLIRKSFNVCFEIVTNIFDYIRIYMKKDNLLIKI